MSFRDFYAAKQYHSDFDDSNDESDESEDSADEEA